jgi:hypothetical protein
VGAVVNFPLPFARPLCRLSLCAAAWLAMAAPAFASANVACAIDDKFIMFEMEAIAGRSGPITQVHVGNIEIKPAAKVDLVRLDAKTEKYRGRYVLKILRAAKETKLSGRIKECEAG